MEISMYLAMCFIAGYMEISTYLNMNSAGRKVEISMQNTCFFMCSAGFAFHPRYMLFETNFTSWSDSLLKSNFFFRTLTTLTSFLRLIFTITSAFYYIPFFFLFLQKQKFNSVYATSVETEEDWEAEVWGEKELRLGRANNLHARNEAYLSSSV